MTSIELRGKQFSVPTQWNELSFAQLLQIIKVVYAGHELETGKLLLLKILTGCGTAAWACLQLDDIAEYLYLPDFLIKESRLTKQLVPNQGTFAGPADNFNNLVMAEFVFSEDYYFKFKEQETEIQHLNNLVAVLFRPVKPGYDLKVNPDGDPREPFNENKCLHRAAKKISKWNIHIKLAILTWYEACRIQMVQDFQKVFAGGDGEPARYGLLSMMRNVAQTGTHGGFKDVENMFVKLVMIELDEMMTEAEQIEKLKPKK